jgi:hypothetical protein
MSNELAKTVSAELIEKVVIGGDLKNLSPAERVSYYNAVCESTGLNPLTQPFGYLNLNGKTVLYALKSCTDQLRKINHVSVSALEAKEASGLYVVTCQVKDASGRTDASTGAVAIANLRGDALANAIMKAETKAKRRATLSICGLSLLDETEVETIPGSQTVNVHQELPNPQESETSAPVDPQAAIKVSYEKWASAIPRADKQEKLPVLWEAFLKAYTWPDDMRDEFGKRLDARKLELDALANAPTVTPLAKLHDEVRKQFLRIGTSEAVQRAMLDKYDVAEVGKLAKGGANALIAELVKIATMDELVAKEES